MMKILKFTLGICLAVLIAIAPFSQFQSSPVESLQNLVVQLDGRKKPLDTVARETVAKIHGKTSYETLAGEKLDYLQTYLSLWFNNRDWNQEPFILFSYRPLKEKIGLKLEQKYFTFQEIINSDLASVIRQAREKQADNIDLTRDEREALTVEDRLALMIETVEQDYLPIVPHPMDIKGKWLGITEAAQYYSDAEIAPVIQDYKNLKETYQFNPHDLEQLGIVAQNLGEKLQNLSPSVYPDRSLVRKEVSFYKLHLFGKAWQLYAIAFALILMTVGFNLNLYEIALGFCSSGLMIQSYGFWSRMQIAGRPPVTNMYESVIWVGFGIAALALFFEITSQAKYYLLAAAPLAVACLLLADNLPAVLDPSIQPLVPVLRDNFWLSVHVPTITLSYASFALAMGLGHLILGYYVFNPQSPKIPSLSKLNYRVLQAGVLLLTTGIILGGIWAHFSWGRFWGWDPKETWALIALISYLVPLHGRLVGWLKDFGITVASVVCFNTVLMAWYGVNFVLGTGLHSYGFSTGGSELIVASFVGLDLLFVLAATIRTKGWLTVASDTQVVVTTSISQQDV